MQCLECRRRKVKCNQARPCDQCTKGRRPGCTYSPHLGATVPPPQPWVFGKPEKYGPSSHAINSTRSPPPRREPTNNPQGLTQDLMRSPALEHNTDGMVRTRNLNLLPQPTPTPGASPGIPLVGSESRVSVAGSLPITTPCSEDSYQSRWLGSDQWDRQPSESSTDVRQRISLTERRHLNEENEITDSAQSKLSNMTIATHGT